MKPTINTLSSLALMAFGISLSTGACQTSEDTINKAEFAKLHKKMNSMERQLAGLAGAVQKRAPGPKRPKPGTLYNVPVHKDDSYRGGEDAMVTIVAATEFSCPYCQQFAKISDELLSKYDDSELKVVSKHFVVHPDRATKSALASCAAGMQGKFTEYDRALWLSAWPNNRLVLEKLGDASLEQLAKDLKLDMGKYHRDIKGACNATLARNRKEIRTLGVSWTPAVYINGMYYTGGLSAEAFQSAVDAELQKVKASTKHGAMMANYYDTLVAKGRKTL